MTEEQLLYFTSIVEFGSYSEAALELSISQSTISKQIAHLENEIGVKLFDRSTRKASLSAEGEALYSEAAVLLSQMKAFRNHAQALSLGDRRKIDIIALPFVGNLNFYVPIFTFEDSHLNCEVHLYELEDNELYRRIAAKDYDVAICYYDPDHMGNQVRFYPIFDNKMVAAIHKSNPISKEKALTPKMLDNVNVMGTQVFTTLNKVYELYFKKHKVNPHVIFRSRPQTLLGAAAAKKSIALLDSLHANMFRTPADIVLLPFSPSLKCVVGIAVDEEKADDPIIRDLVEALSKT
ncbi:MAG: LysR family transcriptional regulator [Lachnospiraceae bacterium]|nr:LysR family transcriptional regulator [Lachnospiraceae bacterium]